MIRLVDKIEKAKYITHSGTMHADEVFATAFLSLYKGDIDLFRTPEVKEEDYPNALIYDIGRGKYDHHQEDRRVRDNGIPYCSLGLLWDSFGRDFLEKRNIEYVEEVWQGIDKDFIEGIDAIDNGIFPKIESEFKVRHTSDIIKLFNPSFGSNEDESTQFLKAVDVAKVIFEEEILNINGRVKAKKILEDKIEEAKQKHYLVLDEFMPYEETIYTQDTDKQIYFVVYPSNRGGYGAKTLYNSAEDHIQRVPFPEEWAGCGEDLAEVSGVEGATFCHLGRFIVSAKTKEATIKLVELAIEKNDNKENKIDENVDIESLES